MVWQVPAKERVESQPVGWQMPETDINIKQESGSLLARYGKQIYNSFARIGEEIISSPFSPIGIPEKEIELYKPKARKELELSGFKGSPAEGEQLIGVRAAELAAEATVHKYKVEPAENLSEKAIDVGAGLTSFFAQLAATRKFLPKGTSEPIVWEVQSQLSGGLPGEGAAMASAYGLIGKIPAVSIGGKVLKTGAQSALLGGVTAAYGGDTEDIIIASLIPVAFQGYQSAKGRISDIQMMNTWRRKLPFTRDIPTKDSLKYAKAMRSAFELGKTKDFRLKGKEYKQWHKRYGGDVDLFLKQANDAFVKAGGQPVKPAGLITGAAPTEAVKAPSVAQEAITPAEPTVTAPKAEIMPTKPPEVAAPEAQAVTVPDKITNLIVKESLDTVKISLSKAVEAVKNIPKMATFYTGRAAEVIDKNYGSIPEGKRLATDTREIAFRTANREAKQIDDFKKVVKSLTHQERIQLGKLGQRRKISTNPKLQKINAQLLEIMDKDMFDADAAGYRRLLGGEWHNIKGTGGWFPQTLNRNGRDIMNRARQKGLGDPKVNATAERMVALGDAKTIDLALAQMIDWYNQSMRGTAGYFERTRTILPEDMVEFDIARVIPHTIHKNSKMIAAAKQWGVEYEQEGRRPEYNLWGAEVKPDVANKRLDFIKAREYLGQIGNAFGAGDAQALKKWIRTEFGLANDLPDFITNTINTINAYETNVRLGFRVPSAVRNFGQGNMNLFTAPIPAHFKTANIVMFRKWSSEAAKLYEEVKRSGAIGGMKEIAEIEKGAGAEPQTPGLALKMFTSAEESNHIRAALIGRFSAEQKIKDLAQLKEGNRLKNALIHLRYLSIDPEGYLARFIKNKTFTNPITDAEVDDIWSGRKQLTLEDYERIMHRSSVDTQFIQNFAKRPIPWRSNPWLRMGMKFKTFAIDQTRLIYQDAVKEAMKGTFAPLAKYLLFSAMIGEIWNLTKDFLVGGDQAVSTQIIMRPEKRNIKDLAIGLANDFVDGAGVGILTDITWGVGNWVAGPAIQTGRNLLEWASNLRHPVMATRKLAYKEAAAMKDLEGLMARADRIFINSNNRFFEYKRWRDRSFEWQEKQKRPGFVKRAGKTFRKMLLGPQRYPKILPYEYAAKQITFGDVEDAAEYLKEQIRVDDRNKYEIRQSMIDSMNNYSPLGPIAKKDVHNFLKQFSEEERKAVIKLDNMWKRDYRKSINLAFRKE